MNEDLVLSLCKLLEDRDKVLTSYHRKVISVVLDSLHCEVKLLNKLKEIKSETADQRVYEWYGNTRCFGLYR